MKKKYYDIKNLLKIPAQYYILLGKRTNGKSYQVKETILKDYFGDGIKFVILRRREPKFVLDKTDYFADMNINKYSNGEWDGVVCKSNRYFLYQDAENGKQIMGPQIGWFATLSTASQYKSAGAFQTDSVYTGNIVYEEFITDGGEAYLTNEPRKLMQFVSTVARDRKLRVFLIGNTISRVCPYMKEWSLPGVLNQKPGTIETYTYHFKSEETGDESEVVLAVENCKASDGGKNTLFFGNAAKNIVDGQWDVHEAPTLQKEYRAYTCVYEVYVKCQLFGFVMQLLLDEESENCDRILYVYPCKRKRDSIERIITDEYSPSRLVTSCFDTDRRPEAIMYDLFHNGKCTFSDNLTAADFNGICEYLNL